MNRLELRITTLLLALLTLGAQAPAAQADNGPRQLSLDQALELALATDESVLMAEADAEVAAGAVKEAWSAALPSVSLSGSYQANLKKAVFFAPEEFGGGQLEMGEDLELAAQLRVDQVLYAFGRVGKAIDFAGTYEDIAGVGVEAARRDLAYRTRVAYHAVQLAAEFVEIETLSLRQARSHLERTEVLLEEGSAARYDLLRARVEVENRQPALIAAENNARLAMDDLKRLLGIQDEADPVLSDSLAFTPIRLEEAAARAEALAARPELCMLRLQVDGNRYLVGIERAARLPVFSAFGTLSMTGQTGNDDPLGVFKDDKSALISSVGVALQLPVFDGGKTTGKVRQARASLRRSEYALRQAEEGVTLQLRKALRDIEALTREHEAQRATVALAEETYGIALTRHENGLATRLELSDAETALDAARTAQAETLYRYNVALAALDLALGR